MEFSTFLSFIIMAKSTTINLQNNIQTHRIIKNVYSSRATANKRKLIDDGTPSSNNFDQKACDDSERVLSNSGIETLEVINVSNFDIYLINDCNHYYTMTRYNVIIALHPKFSLEYKIFNSFKISNHKWAVLTPDQELFNPLIVTYCNTHCAESIEIPYALYVRNVHDKWHCLIVYKNAIIRQGFQWTGFVFIGSETQIGYNVLLENHVLISNSCYIGNFSVIKHSTLVGPNTVIHSNILIGMGNVFENCNVICRSDLNTNDNLAENSRWAHKKGVNPILLEDLRFLGSYNVFSMQTRWEIQKAPRNFYSISRDTIKSGLL